MKQKQFEKVGKMVVEVKELCKKQEGKDKKKSDGGNTKRGRGQKWTSAQFSLVEEKLYL